MSDIDVANEAGTEELRDLRERMKHYSDACKDCNPSPQLQEPKIVKSLLRSFPFPSPSL
jgi:hypothetical protein